MNYQLPANIKQDSIFIIKRSEIEGRLDPNFYNSVYRANRNKLNNSKIKVISFRDIIKEFSGGPMGFHLHTYDYTEEGVPILRIGNLTEMYLNPNDKFIYVSEQKHNELNKSKVQEGDIIFSKAGKVGEMSIVPKGFGEANLNQALSRIKLIDGVNNEFVYIYFKSYIGGLQIQRFGSGRAVQDDLKMSEIEHFKIALPSIEIQNKVVTFYKDAYKQKYQKEAEANSISQSINDYLLKVLGISLPPQNTSIDSRIFRINFREVVGSRLDPFYYITEFKSIESKIEASKWEVFSLNELFQINRGGSPRPIEKYITDDENGINWIKIGDTKNDDKYIYTTAQKIIPEGVKSSRMVYEGDFILSNSMSFGRPYIMKTSGCIHDGWLLFRPKIKDFNQDFFHTILSSELIYRLFKKATIGGVVENLNIDLVKKIKIPLPPKEIQTQIAEHITGLRIKANQLNAEAQLLVENAKAEVEKIILG